MNAVKSLFSKYLSHLTGYVVAAATVVTAVDPTALPPLGKLAVGVAGLVVFAANHAYQAGTGVAAAQAAVNAVSSALAAAKPAALILALAIGLPLLHGCATLQKVDGVVTSPAAQPFITTGALVAVVAAEAKGISPVQINAIAKAALAADTGTGATLAAIGAAIDAQVAKLNLPLIDVAVIKTVELEFANYITQQTKDNPTVAQTQAAVADVLNAFIMASGG